MSTVGRVKIVRTLTDEGEKTQTIPVYQLERAATATRSLKSAVECGNLPGLKLLFTYGAKCKVHELRELLLVAMKCPRHPSCHREMIKILLDRGATLDTSDNSCKHLLDYVVRGMQKNIREGNFGYTGGTVQLRNIAEFTGDLSILLSSGGADLALLKVLEDPRFVNELGVAVHQCGKDANISSLLMHYFLDWGLDPNSSMQVSQIAQRRSLLSFFLDGRSWEAAALLLEYGAYQPGKILASYSGQTIKVFDSFEIYIDSFKDRAPNRFYLLEQGMAKKLYRRKEVCLMHLKPVLDPACKPFDTSPLSAIVSEYLL